MTDTKLGRCDFKQYEHRGSHDRIPEVGQRFPPFGCKNWKPDSAASESASTSAGEDAMQPCITCGHERLFSENPSGLCRKPVRREASRHKSTAETHADDFTACGCKCEFSSAGEDDYVAWCRYDFTNEETTGAAIDVCDSDAKGAFKVYRRASSIAGEDEKPNAYSEILAGTLAVHRLDCTLVDFARGLKYYAEQESRKINCDTGLIRLLQRAACVGWENIQLGTAKIVQPTEFSSAGEDAKPDAFCYAEGDEGAKYCGDPKSRHCSVIGDTEFWRTPEAQEHLVKCMRDDHLIHHVFLSEPLQPKPNPVGEDDQVEVKAE